MGLSIRATSRMTGYDRKTIGRYLAGSASPSGVWAEGVCREQVGAIQGVSEGTAAGGRLERRGASTGTARAQLQRRLHDSEGLAAAVA